MSWYNGAPGFLIYEAGKLVTAINLCVEDDRIAEIFALRNPDKLRPFEALTD